MLPAEPALQITNDRVFRVGIIPTYEDVMIAVRDHPGVTISVAVKVFNDLTTLTLGKRRWMVSPSESVFEMNKLGGIPCEKSSDPQGLANQLSLLMDGAFMAIRVHGVDNPAANVGHYVEQLIAYTLG